MAIKDPLHDALVSIFLAIAEREDKSVEEVVEEFINSYRNESVRFATHT